MPVPWEALIPLGIYLWLVVSYSSNEALQTSGLLTAMFGTAGTLFNITTKAQNQGKVGSLLFLNARILCVPFA
jgi:hypothetical protein